MLAVPRFRALFVATLLACGASAPALAEDSFGSILFQNDLFFGRDGGGYTNGIFISRMRVASPGETGVAPPFLLKPIVGWLGMPEATLASSTLGQALVTPRDISRTVPDPSDAPYVGALMFRSASVYVHDDIADMVAISLGVIGPAAGGEQTQRLIHRVIDASRPEGWDSQRSNKGLLGIERYRAWRSPWGDTVAGKASGDFITLAGGTLGNFETSVGGSLMLRYGQGLERSFPTVPRVAAFGGDPFVVGQGWFVYTALSADRIFKDVGIGNDTLAGGAPRLRKARYIAVAGLAYGWAESSLTFSLQSANPLVESTNRRQSYGSLTYTWRMR